MFLLAQLPAEEVSAQLKNGVLLMGLGMGVVFAFLALLVVVTKIVSSIVRKKEGANNASMSGEIESLKSRIQALESELQAIKANGSYRVRGYGAAVPKSPIVVSATPQVAAVQAPAGSAPTAGAVPAPAPAQASVPAPAGGKVVAAPMPGLVLRIEVKQGQAVKNGQLVMVMEAMKMENEIYAPCDGTISSIAVSQGQQLNAGDTLMTIA